MSTLITGACGFVGLALAEQLLAQGEAVIGFDLQAPPAAALASFATLAGHYTHVQGDVVDAASLDQTFSRHTPNRVVSLAAITADARRERSAPASIANVNIGGAWTVISAAARQGVQRVVHASSGSVYGHSGREPGLLDEDATALRPEALYGISKLAAETGALRLGELHGLDVRIARLGTCFGPWEADTGVRDTLSAPLQVLHRAAAGEAVVLPRDSRRDWLYVRDVAAGIAALLDTVHLPRTVYNVAAGFEWQVSDWCEHLRSAFPSFTWRFATEGEPANIDYYAPYDRASLRIDRLRADTGFQPHFDLPAAAADYLTWFAAHRTSHINLP